MVGASGVDVTNLTQVVDLDEGTGIAAAWDGPMAPRRNSATMPGLPASSANSREVPQMTEYLDSLGSTRRRHNDHRLLGRKLVRRPRPWRVSS